MHKKIASTFFTKAVCSATSFLLVMLTARLLGAEARGNITLIILGVSINAMVSQIAGGPTLVYLISRLNTGSITAISYIWAIFSCTILSILMAYNEFIPSQYFWPVLITSLIHSFSFIHTSMLLGKQNIFQHNLITLLHYLSHLISFLLFVYLGGAKNLSAFIYSLYISNGLLLLTSIILTQKFISKPDFKSLSGDLKLMFKFGFIAQLATLAHLMSIRVSYYFLNQNLGTDSVGVFSIGVSVTEAVLLIGTSITMVLYTHVANSENTAHSRELTIKMAKISFLLATPVLLVLSLMPPAFFTAFFGNEFDSLPQIILTLAPGLSALCFYMVYSSYYAGLGKYHINAIASSISFLVTLVGSFLLVPKFGLAGAGWVCSAAYFAATLFYLVLFSSQNKTKITKLLPSPISDYKQYIDLILKKKLTDVRH